MSVRAVLFDLDGTLVDSLPGIEFSVDQAIDVCGLPPRQADLRQMIGPPIRSILARISAMSGERLDQLERAFRLSYDAVGWEKTELYRGAMDVLRTLHDQNVLLAIVTNKPKQVTGRILQRTGIRDLFDHVVSRDSRTPPFGAKAEMIRFVLTESGVRPDTAVFVGDTYEDHEAATVEGVRSVIVRHGYGGFDSVRHDDCKDSFDGFQDVMGFVRWIHD